MIGVINIFGVIKCSNDSQQDGQIEPKNYFGFLDEPGVYGIAGGIIGASVIGLTNQISNKPKTSNSKSLNNDLNENNLTTQINAQFNQRNKEITKEIKNFKIKWQELATELKEEYVNHDKHFRFVKKFTPKLKEMKKAATQKLEALFLNLPTMISQEQIGIMNQNISELAVIIHRQKFFTYQIKLFNDNEKFSFDELKSFAFFIIEQCKYLYKVFELPESQIQKINLDLDVDYLNKCIEKLLSRLRTDKGSAATCLELINYITQHKNQLKNLQRSRKAKL